MRCDEIQERFVELLYDESGTPAAGSELKAHVSSCPACQRQLEELQGVRRALSAWKDEPPLRTVALAPLRPAGALRRLPFLRPMGYAAAAAVLALAVLALANAEISWGERGFSFRTHVFGPAPGDYYTKSEVRDILKRVLDESETRQVETSMLMMHRMLDLVEKERQADLRILRSSFLAAQNND